MDNQVRNNRENAAKRRALQFGLFSIGLGLAELFCARGLARWMGMKGRENLLRLYGVREIATGIGIFACKDDPASFMWGRVAGDAIDIATLAASVSGNTAARIRRKGEHGMRPSFMGVFTHSSRSMKLW